MKKIFLIPLIFLIIFSGCGENFFNKEKKISDEKKIFSDEENFFSLKAENFSEEIELTGTLEADKKAFVSAKQAGRIAELNFEVGDFVFKNTLLGKLVGDKSRVNFQNAKSNVSNLRNLFYAQNNLLDEKINSAKKALELAQENLKAVGIQKNANFLTGSQQKILYEKKINEAEVNLENIKISNKNNLNTLYKNAISEIRLGFISSSQTIDFLDNLLGITPENKHNNDLFEGNLGTLKSTSKSDALNSARKIFVEFEEFSIFYNSELEGKNPSKGTINEGLLKKINLLENLQIVLKNSYSMLENSTSGSNFSEKYLNNLKTQNINLGHLIEKSLISSNGGVKNIKNLIKNSKINGDNLVKSAQTGLSSAKQALLQISASSSQSFSNSSSNKEISKKQVEQAEISLKTAIANKASLLKNLESKISLASGSQKLSQVAIGDTQFGAPFDGIIVEKISEIGEFVGAGQSIYKIADIENYKITSDISDMQIGKLQIGQKIQFGINGLSGVFNGKLTKIYPEVDKFSRKIKIEFTVEEKNLNFKIGSFARIKLFIENKNGFFIPEKFLNFDKNGAFLFLKIGEKKMQKKYVKIGLDKITNSREIEKKIWFSGNMEGKKIFLNK